MLAGSFLFFPMEKSDCDRYLTIYALKVALLNIDGGIIGSGSLLDGRYVVTAAHKIAG